MTEKYNLRVNLDEHHMNLIQVIGYRYGIVQKSEIIRKALQTLADEESRLQKMEATFRKVLAEREATR